MGGLGLCGTERGVRRQERASGLLHQDQSAFDAFADAAGSPEEFQELCPSAARSVPERGAGVLQRFPISGLPPPRIAHALEQFRPPVLGQRPDLDLTAKPPLTRDDMHRPVTVAGARWQFIPMLILYQSRRTLHTGADLLTDKQQRRLDALFADARHVEVEATRGRLPAHDLGLPHQAQSGGQEGHDPADRGDRHRCPRQPGRGRQAAPHPDQATRRHPRLLRPPPFQQRTHRSDQRTASNTYAAPPWASATSPTTSPDHYSRPAGSDQIYTLDCEEPLSGTSL